MIFQFIKMQYTKDNIDGLLINPKSSEYKYKIHKIGNDAYELLVGNSKYPGYDSQKIINFLNKGTWLVVEAPIVENFPIY